jgi:uncharacterized Zn finger protein (UPF0148 family)
MVAMDELEAEYTNRPLIKGKNAKQVHCPKCGASQLVPKKGSKKCKFCGYTRTTADE